MRVGTLIGTWGGRAKQCLGLRACVACDCVRNIAVGVSRPSHVEMLYPFYIGHAVSSRWLSHVRKLIAIQICLTIGAAKTDRGVNFETRFP